MIPSDSYTAIFMYSFKYELGVTAFVLCVLSFLQNFQTICPTNIGLHVIKILFHKQIFQNAYWLFQVYADYVTISGGSVHTTKENAKALVIARKEIGLEVNVDKTKLRTWSCLDIKMQDEVSTD